MRKKKVSRFSWLNKKVGMLSGVGLLTILGGVWSLDQHWLPREIHNISIAQMQQSIGGIQKEVAVQSARSEVFYWMRREQELKAACAKNPRDALVKKDLEEAIIERRRAEDEVKKLQTMK